MSPGESMEVCLLIPCALYQISTEGDKLKTDKPYDAIDIRLV